MSSLSYEECVKHRLEKSPELNYLAHFLYDDQLGNKVSKDRSTIAHHAAVLEPRNGEWHHKSRNLDHRALQPPIGADKQVIVLDYLDSDAIQLLGITFNIDPWFFQTHLAGSEQHFNGDWAPSDLTASPCPYSQRYKSRFISVNYRRPYPVPDAIAYTRFNENRIRTCSLLRSHHLTNGAKVLFEHERVSMTWFPSNSTRQYGQRLIALIYICLRIC